MVCVDFHVQGQATDIAIQAEEILKLKRTMNELLSMHTGQSLATVGKTQNHTPCSNCKPHPLVVTLNHTPF